MHTEYLTLARDDLFNRMTDGSILINDTVTVPVRAAIISSHPIIGLQKAIAVQIQAEHIDSVPVITNIKLKTADGIVVAEKNVYIEGNGAQFLTVAFVVQVKEGL